MTLTTLEGKCNGKVENVPSQCYARWRALQGSRSLLHEPTRPPEQLLQSIWQHQRLRREALRTLDGTPLRVWHPGFWNRGAGPDFSDALLQFGPASPRNGDVEVDLVPSSWRGHGHAQNPTFQKVILQVVWEEPLNPELARPILALKPFLDAPLEELQLWLGSEVSRHWPESAWGHCSQPLRELQGAALRDLLHSAAQVRLQAKAHALGARAREVGATGALWEGVFRALGYRHNAWAMQHLAEGLEPDPGLPVLVWQARLFGMAGLLPPDLAGLAPDAIAQLRGLWDVWWREQDAWAERILPAATWRWQGLRPSNHPLRRLALGAHWLTSGAFQARLESWLTEPATGAGSVKKLSLILRDYRDSFWERHWTFHRPVRGEPVGLLGSDRVTDLAMNVILPWFWMRAEAGKNSGLQQRVLEQYLGWPAGQESAPLRLARERLLGGTLPGMVRGAACQQALLQIQRDFCQHSNAICAGCPFPDLVRQQKTPGPGR